MILIVGLGNPGEQYEKTPHNMGFRALDCFKKRYLPSQAFIALYQGKFLRGELSGKEIILFKPLTYMNHSAFAIKELRKAIYVSLAQLWLVHDEFDLPWGEMKIDYDRSSAGHKGVQSIIDSIGTQAFWRFRIGIKPDTELTMPLDEYLTQVDADQSEEYIEGLLEKVSALLRDALENGIKKKKATYTKF